MNGKLLSDTNAIIAIFARDQKVRELLANADDVFVPIFAKHTISKIVSFDKQFDSTNVERV